MAVCQGQRVFTGDSPTMQALRLALQLRCDPGGARPYDDIADEFPRLPVTGDFNGDGKTDVLDYAAGSRPDHLWYGTANGFRAGATVSINGLYFPFVGDFNGDGRDDVLWFSLLPGGETSVWYGSGGSKPFVAGPALDAPQFIPQSGDDGDMYIPGIGDFDGDGKADIGWLDEGIDLPGMHAKNASIIWYGRANGFHVASATVPTPPCVSIDNEAAKADDVVGITITISVCSAMVADFNGDGKADLLFYRSGSGADALEYSTGTGFHAGPAISVSGLYEFPFGGDFNGDGKGDVFWYAPGPGTTTSGTARRVASGPASVWKSTAPTSRSAATSMATARPTSSGTRLVRTRLPVVRTASGFRDGPTIGVNGTLRAERRRLQRRRQGRHRLAVAERQPVAHLVRRGVGVPRRQPGQALTMRRPSRCQRSCARDRNRPRINRGRGARQRHAAAP